MPRVAVDRLTGYAMAALRPFGVDDGHARIVAESVVDADVDGHATQGISRLPALIDGLRAGRIDPHATLRVGGDARAVATLDAGSAFGQVACARGAELAMERARLSGIGLAAVRCRNQPGAAGWFLRHIAGGGLIGLAFTSAETGSSLIGAALPAGDRPVLLDVAVNRLGGGHVLHAAEGLDAVAISPEGHGGVATATALAPPPAPGAGGGDRSAVLAMLVGMLAGVEQAGDEAGHVFVAIDPNALPGFRARVAKMLGEPAPRDRRERDRARRLTDGVEVSDDVATALIAATGAPI